MTLCSYLCHLVEGNAVDFKSVDSEVGGEKDAGGTNILVSHVTGLTPTLNGEHVSLHAGVKEDCTIATQPQEKCHSITDFP